MYLESRYGYSTTHRRSMPGFTPAPAAQRKVLFGVFRPDFEGGV
jgi:hypothetical protein